MASAAASSHPPPCRAAHCGSSIDGEGPSDGGLTWARSAEIEAESVGRPCARAEDVAAIPCIFHTGGIQAAHHQ
jgi:hypothetical protein